MLKWLKKAVGLGEPEPIKTPTEFEVGVENKKLVIKFNQPTIRIELDRLQTLNLIQALTNKVTLTQKASK